MKEFKAKKIKNKKKKKKRITLIIFTFFFFFSYVFMIKYLRQNQFKKNILDNNVNYVNFNIKQNTINTIDKMINKPVSVLNDKVKNAKVIKTIIKKTTTKNKQSKNEEKEVLANSKEPIIYIYNTHQGEEYNGYSVYDAAHNLSEKLKNNGVCSYFEEQSVKVFLDTNNLKYYKSYTASRKYLDNAINNYPSIKYFFDIHRDSVSKNLSTITYNNKSYAKVLFVIGLDNQNNEKNNNNANILNEIIKKKIPNISRGIVKHGGKGYNGVYNQDVSENAFLIEIGGKDNTKEEVENTIEVIYESIIEYIRGVV